MTNAKAQLSILLDVRARLLQLTDDMGTDGFWDLLYDPTSELEEIIQQIEEAVALNPETAAPSTQLGGGNHD